MAALEDESLYSSLTASNSSSLIFGEDWADSPGKKAFLLDITSYAEQPQAEVIEFEPLGVAHKRFGGCTLPPFLSASAVAQLVTRWRPRPDDKFLAIVPSLTFCDFMMQLSVPLISLVEQRHVEQGALFFDNEPAAFVERCLVHAVNAGGLEQVERAGSTEGQRCLVTRSPPWMLPVLGPRKASSDGQATPPGGGVVAVFCSDPRFLLLQEFKGWDVLHMISPMFGGRALSPGEKLQVTAFVEAMLTADVFRRCNVINVLADWAKEEAKRPGEVRFFFLEDFLSEPETAARGFARFFGVPEHSEVSVDAFAQVAELASRFSQELPKAEGLPAIKDATMKFERLLRRLSPDVQSVWEESILTWRQLPHPRLAFFANALCQHEVWDPPHWWVAHNALECRPCLFHFRGRCQEDEACGFCHGVGHKRAPRLSKKERDRKARQRRCPRTPSPQGLSS